MNDDAPDTERPPAEDRLADALDAIVDVLADMSVASSEGVDRLERMIATEVGGLREQQERDYARVTRLDEAHHVHLRSIDAGISRIIELLEPVQDRVAALCERVTAIEKRGLNGGVPHQ